MDERMAHLGWQLCRGVGAVTFGQLVAKFGSASAAWVADDSAMVDAGMSENAAKKLVANRQQVDVDGVMKKLVAFGGLYVCQADEQFPGRLRAVNPAPIGIFCQGNVALLNEELRSYLAVVGTRKITDYGRLVTSRLVEEVAATGVIIVSGLMYGVDEAAHRACLRAGGSTIGVWAGGLDSLATGSRSRLAEDILKAGGLLISEYPLGVMPSPPMFPARNRIVAGLSQSVLVTEGSEKSGTLITAGFAADQGKDVLAVPGPITSSQSDATSLLIKQGATLVSSGNDVLEVLGISSHVSQVDLNSLSEQERQIWLHLREGASTNDEIVRVLKINPGELAGVLSMMELSGVIERLGDEWVVRKG